MLDVGLHPDADHIGLSCLSFEVSMVSPCQHLLNPFLFATSRYHDSPSTVKAKLFFFLWAYTREIQ